MSLETMQALIFLLLSCSGSGGGGSRQTIQLVNGVLVVSSEG